MLVATEAGSEADAASATACCSSVIGSMTAAAFLDARFGDLETRADAGADTGAGASSVSAAIVGGFVVVGRFRAGEAFSRPIESRAWSGESALAHSRLWGGGRFLPIVPRASSKHYSFFCLACAVRPQGSTSSRAPGTYMSRYRCRGTCRCEVGVGSSRPPVSFSI